MKAGDIVVIKASAHSGGSAWFRETRDNCTPMLVTNIDQDDAVSPIFWRVTVIHPTGVVVYVSADHLEAFA